MKLFILLIAVAFSSIADARERSGRLVDEYVRGSNRICVYDLGGGEERTKRVHSSSPCPVSATFDD